MTRIATLAGRSIVLIALLIAPSVALAATLDEAETAYIEGRYLEAAELGEALGTSAGYALAADALAKAADFFAIGTNDLTMYTLAIDRGEEGVAYLYNPLHPAVLRLIQFSVEAALRARIPICICGEMAGDPRYTALFLGLGVRDLSMTAHALPRVKSRILGVDLQAATRRASARSSVSSPSKPRARTRSIVTCWRRPDPSR